MVDFSIECSTEINWTDSSSVLDVLSKLVSFLLLGSGVEITESMESRELIRRCFLTWDDDSVYKELIYKYVLINRLPTEKVQ